MRFDEAYGCWQRGHLTQAEAGRLLGMSERNFRRYVDRYRVEGETGLLDRRLTQASNRCAPVDEVLRLTDLYDNRYNGWNVKHFYSFYKREHHGQRSYTWVKTALQRAGLVRKAKGKGKHRIRRERAAMEGMMLHQDGSTHAWIADVKWDLIITLDDATSTHYSMFFVDEEGTVSSFRGMRDVIAAHGLPSSFYSDRGSHYWYTPQAGGKVDKHNLTQFGRAMRHLGIEMIAAYSPEARGRCERMTR
ncbi:MAG: helix-turn-helix domain-containing protein [Mariprofundaceae bacterium]|nr:helix-turn-helix domain-containing protein [Mariprofundaceae bacterium]